MYSHMFVETYVKWSVMRAVFHVLGTGVLSQYSIFYTSHCIVFPLTAWFWTQQMYCYHACGLDTLNASVVFSKQTHSKRSGNENNTDNKMLSCILNYIYKECKVQYMSMFAISNSHFSDCLNQTAGLNTAIWRIMQDWQLIQCYIHN